VTGAEYSTLPAASLPLGSVPRYPIEPGRHKDPRRRHRSPSFSRRQGAWPFSCSTTTAGIPCWWKG